MKDQIAILKINYHAIALPADKAMKVMQLLSGAVNVSHDYDRTGHGLRSIYHVGEPLQLAIEIASDRDQFRTINDEPCDLQKARPMGRKPHAIEGPKRR